MQFTKEHVMTCILSVAISMGSMAVWGAVHPAASFVKVDVDTIINAGKSTLEKQMKPNMSQDEQKAILLKIQHYSVGLDNAISKIANDCKCAVLNSNALVRVPSTGLSNVKDMTEAAQASAMEAMAATHP